MALGLDTITVGRRTYRVQRVANPEALLVRVRFILYDPHGRRWLLGPSTERPEHLVARAPLTHVSPLRLPPASLIRVRFAEDEQGNLGLAPLDG